jgi:hypothetical protein
VQFAVVLTILFQAQLDSSTSKTEQLQQEHAAQMQSLAAGHQSAQITTQQKFQKLQVSGLLQFILCKLAKCSRNSRTRVQDAVDAAEKRAASLSLELKQLQAINNSQGLSYDHEVMIFAGIQVVRRTIVIAPSTGAANVIGYH